MRCRLRFINQRKPLENKTKRTEKNHAMVATLRSNRFNPLNYPHRDKGVKPRDSKHEVGDNIASFHLILPHFISLHLTSPQRVLRQPVSHPGTLPVTGLDAFPRRCRRGPRVSTIKPKVDACTHGKEDRGGRGGEKRWISKKGVAKLHMIMD